MQTHEFPTNLGARRLPAFTLATALAWLGHECSGTCPKQAVHARANTWLIGPPAQGRPTGTRSLVDVEFTEPTWSGGEGIVLMNQINTCTADDRIHILEWSANEPIAIEAVSTLPGDVVAAP